ncbi:MAG: 1,4-alpha-glucan branching enzyme, partial [Pirellulaceae bacterium]|nr:1,4-alpha-glucan branching enzyme [Pirellulaceae bacterium]
MKTESDKTAFSDQDLQRFLDGNHDDIYNLLGAHPCDREGVSGVNFAVWAPNATGVSVVGDFNDWDQTADQMKSVAASGIWEAFVPTANTGQIYRYRVTDANGTVHEKSDPFGFFGEVPPRSASIVCDLKNYQWQDSHWIDQRAQDNPLEKPV